MTKTQWYYERNTKFLESDLNLPFEKVLLMTDAEFRNWCIDLRKEIVRIWDEEGTPPVVGKNIEDVIASMKQLTTSPPEEMLVKDLISGEMCIRNTKTELSGICNGWFPTMMKTKISYSTKKEAHSIYDYFALDKLLNTFVTYASRHFKRDSFYHYSSPISTGDILLDSHKVTTFESFLEWFNADIKKFGTHSFWLCPVKADKEYTGYNQDLKNRRNITLHIDTIQKMDIASEHMSNIDRERSEYYSVRFYKYGEKLFPVGFKAFRISFSQYAVNFPPFVARFLYEKYTEDFKNQDIINIYDPSAGWSGRLIGAMSVETKRNIHYIGTDPNTDHNTENGRTKYHEIADFFNTHVRSNRLVKKQHTYEIFQSGSEEIYKIPAFQKYKGKLDLVFTSPPYFAKEVYSDDAEQSCHKFSSYDRWRDGFLRPTLETAVEYLRSGRYLLWNIADAQFDNMLLPLEQDSIDILKSLGMEYIRTERMMLAAMPGSNRFEETGETETIRRKTVFGETVTSIPIVKGKMKNFVQIESGNKKIMAKYEPIFVFRKPLISKEK